MMGLEGGSVGFQIGGQATDFVLLVMNDRGANGILSSKVKLGGDASVAAGPVGRDASAETDVSLRAEILSYSRARGIFAGVSLEGSTIRPDNDANVRIYGEKISAKNIVLAHDTTVPPSAAQADGDAERKGRRSTCADGTVSAVDRNAHYLPLPSVPRSAGIFLAIAGREVSNRHGVD